NQGVGNENQLEPQLAADIARAFEDAVVGTFVIKCRRALEQTGLSSLIIAGGVSANLQLRAGLGQMVEQLGSRLYYAKPRFCTDNGAMIAYAGCQRLLAGEYDELEIVARPRWPLETLQPVLVADGSAN
ncbi:MAG: tRNA (adenosine(37)-N6)-threonylcarbamoyltransferase complex transferase subunit TsaD, partial [Gammaproteobacteria bacterium]|nr:tRNA (adenosine(37)-N6)-threonylcarbamoyltransferase complex transferase subunit TsaD [Gammaproteobacteria bacterium]